MIEAETPVIASTTPSEGTEERTSRACAALESDDRLFRYLDPADMDTDAEPGFAHDVATIALAAGCPPKKLRAAILDVAEKVVAYRQATLSICEDLIKRMRSGEPIDDTEFPATAIGAALGELQEDRGRPEDLPNMLWHLERAIHDWERDHESSRKVANALVRAIANHTQAA